MKFYCGDEMYKTVVDDGIDLYNSEKEVYVFLYSDDEKISSAYYRIDNEQAKELTEQSIETGDYWSAFLGYGGRILDGEERCREWFNDNFSGEWEDVTPDKKENNA